MKLYEATSNICKFFINDLVVQKIDFYNSKELERFLKKSLLYIKKRYNISFEGLYNVDIYINKKIGALINMNKQDTIIEYNGIDLKIKIIFDSNFYYKTDIYEILHKQKNVYFYRNFYYINIKNLDELIKYIEYGSIICDDYLDIESKGIKVS